MILTCDEYLKLCTFLNLSPNINNVRQYILLLKDKINRYEKLLMIYLTHLVIILISLSSGVWRVWFKKNNYIS